MWIGLKLTRFVIDSLENCLQFSPQSKPKTKQLWGRNRIRRPEMCGTYPTPRAPPMNWTRIPGSTRIGSVGKLRIQPFGGVLKKFVTWVITTGRSSQVPSLVIIKLFFLELINKFHLCWSPVSMGNFLTTVFLLYF